MKNSGKLKAAAIVFLLALIFSASIARMPSIDAQSSTSGLISRWNFDEGSGTIVHDSAGTNDGTADKTFWSSGKTGSGLGFGGDGKVIIPNSASLNPSVITVEAWVKLNRIAHHANPSSSLEGDSQDLVSKGSLWDNGGYFLQQGGDDASSTTFYFEIAPWTSYQSVNSTYMTLEINRWYQVVGTYDGDNLKIYLDGSLKGTKQIGRVNIVNESPLYMGYEGPRLYNYYLDGTLDEVAIYNRALSESEIHQSYLNFNPSSTTSPQAYDLRGTWLWNDIWLGSKYQHTVTISTFNTDGTFSGTGYNNNGPEKEDVTGQVLGDTITFRWVTTSDVSNGVTLDGTGKVFSSSFMNGTVIQSDGYGSILWDATKIQNLPSTNTQSPSNQPTPSLTSSLTTPPSSIPSNYSIIIVFLGLFLTVIAGVVIWRKIVTNRNGKENAKPLNGYTQQEQTFQEKEKEKAERERQEQERQRAERERAEQWRNEQQRRERAEQAEREQQRQREQRAQQDTQWNNSIDPYGILEVPRIAPQGEVKAAWRKLALKYHPDRCKDKEPVTQELYARKFDEINKAWEEIRKARGWN